MCSFLDPNQPYSRGVPGQGSIQLTCSCGCGSPHLHKPLRSRLTRFATDYSRMQCCALSHADMGG
jgi:hypothetical protein